MSRHRVLIFANPISGRGNAPRLADELVRNIPLQFLPDIILDPPQSLPPFRLTANPETDSVLVLGGDGTLRAVVASFMAANIHMPPILPVPLGTANLIGQYLGITQNRHLTGRIIRTLLDRQVMLLDVARTNFADGSPCLLMASAGLDARIVHTLAAGRSGPIRKLDYFLPTLRTLCTYPFPAISVHADGREIFPLRPGLAFIANIPQYGTHFPILPDARPDDGLLDVAVFPVSSPMETVELAMHIAAGAGGHLHMEGVAHSKARRIEIISNSTGGVPVQVDGEPSGFAPLTVELLPNRLPFFVVAGSR